MYIQETLLSLINTDLPDLSHLIFRVYPGREIEEDVISAFFRRFENALTSVRLIFTVLSSAGGESISILSLLEKQTLNGVPTCLLLPLTFFRIYGDLF